MSPQYRDFRVAGIFLAAEHGDSKMNEEIAKVDRELLVTFPHEWNLVFFLVAEKKD